MELRTFLDYTRNKDELCFWRSTHQQEVDFLIGAHIAIDTKAIKKVTPKNLKGLQTLQEENIFKQFLLILHDPIEPKKIILPVCIGKLPLINFGQEKLYKLPLQDIHT